MTEPTPRLVIAYAFPPYSDTSATVAAKRLLSQGSTVDVVQNRMDEIRSTDPSLELIAGHLVRRRAVLPTRTQFSGWSSIREWCEQGRSQVEAWRAEAEAGGELAEGTGLPWTSLYSRAHFIASHVLAALVKADHPGLHWEAEFSDPCSRDVTGAERFAPVRRDELLDELARAIERAGFAVPATDNVNVWVETLTFALADHVVFTNEHQAEYMIGLIEDPALAERVGARSSCSPHPTLPERFYRISDRRLEREPGTVAIGYFGNVYGTRSLLPLVEALALLQEDLRRRIRLHIFTSDTESLRDHVSALGLAELVRVEPYVPYFDFLALTTQLDVLLAVDALLPDNAARNPFLVSKWSDYRGSGRAVWGMLEETSVLARTDDPALRYRTPTNHLTAAAQMLSRLAREAVPG